MNILELNKEIQYLATHRVEIGILAIDKDRKNDNGATILDYAIWNEYGTATIPPRPFFRHTLENNKAQIAAAIKNALQSVLEGKNTAKEALMQVGETVRGLVILSIANAETWAKPNAKSTLKAKTRDGNDLNTKPLIDNRFLIKSIRYQIVDINTGDIAYLGSFKSF